MNHRLFVRLFWSSCLLLPSFDAVAEQAGCGGITAARALFATALSEREPADRPQVLTRGQPAYFFTDLVNGAGRRILHRWRLDGEAFALVPLRVGSNRWRTWSEVRAEDLRAGSMTVTVETEEGCVFAEAAIDVVEAPSAAGNPAAVQPPAAGEGGSADAVPSRAVQDGAAQAQQQAPTASAPQEPAEAPAEAPAGEVRQASGASSAAVARAPEQAPSPVQTAELGERSEKEPEEVEPETGDVKPDQNPAEAQALLLQALQERQQERFDVAAGLLDRALALMPQAEPQFAELQDERHYHLPLARARWYLRQKQPAPLRQTLDGIRAYLRDHPKRADYSLVVDNYYKALYFMENNAGR